MYLLDSSAIAVVLSGARREAVNVLDGKTTLDLARYELGNVVWKQCVFGNQLSPEEAAGKAESLARVLGLLEIRCVDSVEGFRGVMRLAVELKSTFYDAAYLYIAKEGQLTLVTEDVELAAKAALIGIKVLPVSKLTTCSSADKPYRHMGG